MTKNRLEWTVFGVSLALIAAVSVLLVHQHFTGTGAPASIAAAAGPAIETTGGYAVPIAVSNEGDTTAEDVRLAATLTWAGGSETGEAVLAYVPYRSTRRAWIAFAHDPRDGRLSVRVLGYREP